MTEEELAALAARLREFGAKPKASIPLIEGPSAMEPYAKAAGKPKPKYRAIYTKVLDGVIPAQKFGKQWFLREADLPRIAEVLGLTAPASPGAPHAARRSGTLAASAAA